MRKIIETAVTPKNCYAKDYGANQANQELERQKRVLQHSVSQHHSGENKKIEWYEVSENNITQMVSLSRNQ